MMHYFHKKRGDFSEYMKRFIYYDDEFLVIIIKTFFNDLLSNCIIKDDLVYNFLKNYKEFLDNIDNLVGF